MSDYFLDIAGSTNGPFTRDEIENLYRDGAVNEKTLYAVPGASEWLPLSGLLDIQKPPATTTPVIATVLTPETVYQCPNCGSGDIQSFSMAYHSGISSTSIRGIGTSFDSFGVAVGTATTQSWISATTAPPKRYDSGGGKVIGVCLVIGILTFIFGATLAAVCVSAIGFIIGGLMYYFDSKWNTNEYQRRFVDWDSSWLCKRCGATWKNSNYTRNRLAGS